MDITKDEFLEWRQSKITKVVFQKLAEMKQEKIDMITEAVATPEEYAQAVGYVAGINECLRVEYSDNE